MVDFKKLLEESKDSLLGLIPEHDPEICLYCGKEIHFGYMEFHLTHCKPYLKSHQLCPKNPKCYGIMLMKQCPDQSAIYLECEKCGFVSYINPFWEKDEGKSLI